MNNFENKSNQVGLMNSKQISGYNVVVFFSMMYMAIMIFNTLLTDRYIGYNDFYVLGGTFTSPFFFIFGDIVAEVFGPRIASRMIWFGFISQTIFAILCQIVIRAPYPDVLKDPHVYSSLLGPFLRINLSSFLAFFIANILNVRIITKWKILLKGRLFWLRSICSSTLSEAIYSAIAILMMEISSVPLSDIFKIISISYGIKVVYSLIFAFPANILVNFIKVKTGIDVYDSARFTPFKFLNRKEGE